MSPLTKENEMVVADKLLNEDNSESLKSKSLFAMEKMFAPVGTVDLKAFLDNYCIK